MKIIAHRGASGYAPGNTLSAFGLALKMGSKAFELDVQRTKDGRLVVCHDYDLKCPSGAALKVALTDYAELKKVNIGNKFGFPTERVPLLEETLELLGPAAEWINLEIKNDGGLYPGIEGETLSAVRARPNLAKKVLFSSFDAGTLGRLRELDPAAQLGFLERGIWALLPPRAVLRARKLGAVNLHIHLRLANPLNIALAHRAGLKVCVYTVNRKADAIRMARLGADGIFSDYPDILTREEA